MAARLVFDGTRGTRLCREAKHRNCAQLGTPGAGVMRPIINICDNLTHVGDWRHWRQQPKQVLPWQPKKLAAVYDDPRQTTVVSRIM